MTNDSLVFRTAAALLCLFASAAAPPEPPRYVSISRDSANLREGPSYAHRILWIYKHRNYPLLVIASFDAWRRVRDADGTVGWMHHTQLSDKRSVVFTAAIKTPLRQEDGPGGKIVAYAAPGVVARLRACKLEACEVETSGIDGWVDKKAIWGVSAGEVFQ